MNNKNRGSLKKGTSFFLLQVSVCFLFRRGGLLCNGRYFLGVGFFEQIRFSVFAEHDEYYRKNNEYPKSERTEKRFSCFLLFQARSVTIFSDKLESAYFEKHGNGAECDNRASDCDKREYFTVKRLIAKSKNPKQRHKQMRCGVYRVCQNY